ncbi:alpha/beta hydrolase [Amycolatopsis rhabdoformis]|uniref:Alpha/beta hydrolase n=1 Tax=Amycolatopsis rhabdoformis TaxID=1448059 RepID=A0ABZ1I7A7_9PSEU|nr:alpha/beta hydrolase [Amycolatopsis rhabdoformis]WSE30255.1 alpha/beta hydrolase [Amycolatopsis rhabdoformis]
MVIDGFESGFADVNGIRLHYVAGGAGEPLVLLPGWPRTWYQFREVLPLLARRYRVIAVDLRGMGESDKPSGGYDKKTMARDVFELVRSLGYDEVFVAGEDIGSMVAYSFAANHPEATRKVALWEVGHPAEAFYDLRMLPQDGRPDAPWWFAFNQLDGLPERLLEGRFRVLVDWLIEYQATAPEAIGEEARAHYAAAYDTPEAIRASNGWYQAFGQDIADARGYPVLEMPVLGLGGIYYPFVPALLEGKAADVRFVEFAGAGHYLAEERPGDLVRELVAFFG